MNIKETAKKVLEKLLEMDDASFEKIIDKHKNGDIATSLSDIGYFDYLNSETDNYPFIFNTFIKYAEPTYFTLPAKSFIDIKSFTINTEIQTTAFPIDLCSMSTTVEYHQKPDLYEADEEYLKAA